MSKLSFFWPFPGDTRPGCLQHSLGAPPRSSGCAVPAGPNGWMDRRTDRAVTGHRACSCCRAPGRLQVTGGENPLRETPGATYSCFPVLSSPLGVALVRFLFFPPLWIPASLLTLPTTEVLINAGCPLELLQCFALFPLCRSINTYVLFPVLCLTSQQSSAFCSPSRFSLM